MVQEGMMYKKILAGTTLALLLAGPALAQEPDGKGGADGVAAPGDPRVKPLPEEKAAAEVKAPDGQPVEYALGVSGFFRGEGAGNFDLVNLSYRPQHAEGLFLYRIRPYAVWNPIDDLGMRLEGQWYGYTGGGHHRQEFSLYQGYLDLKTPQGLVSLRAGRQELLYGSTFMLGADAFYNGLSYDALRLRVTPVDSLTLDFLGGYYTYPWSDGVKGDLAGLYTTWTVSEGNALEGYLLRDTGSQDHRPGEETDSVGLRGTLKAGALSLELEPVYQFGETFSSALGRNQDISAYGGHADLNAEFSAGGLKQKLWLGYALGSGSRAAAQGESSRLEFHNQDNDTAIVGDMHVVSDLSGATVSGHHASGLEIYTLGWSADLTKELNLSATGHYFRADAVESGFSRELGLETDFILTYTFSENLSLLLAYDHFFTGRFFGDASGKGGDIHYGYAMLQFNLEKAKLKTPKAEKGV